MPVGPDYEIQLPFTPVIGEEEMFGRVKTETGGITFNEAIPGDDAFAWCMLNGFDSSENYSFDVINVKTQTGLRIEGDTPMSRFHLYCQQFMICPEPFVRLNVKPGETFSWQTKYSIL